MFVILLCDSLLTGHKASGIHLHRLRDDKTSAAPAGSFLSCLCIASGGALVMSGGDYCPHSAAPQPLNVFPTFFDLVDLI